MPKTTQMLVAKGHVAKIVRFDEATALVPLNENEARLLYNSLKSLMQRLEVTGDYPEQAEHVKTLENLMSAMFMLSWHLEISKSRHLRKKAGHYAKGISNTNHNTAHVFQRGVDHGNKMW